MFLPCPVPCLKVVTPVLFVPDATGRIPWAISLTNQTMNHRKVYITDLHGDAGLGVTVCDPDLEITVWEVSENGELVRLPLLPIAPDDGETNRIVYTDAMELGKLIIVVSGSSSRPFDIIIWRFIHDPV